MNEQQIRKGLEEYYRTAAVNNIHWIARELKSQLEREHRLDKQNQKMQALLERWVEKFKNLPDVSYGMWLRDSVNAKDHHKLFSLLTDTKTLLEEAKE